MTIATARQQDYINRLLSTRDLRGTHYFGWTPNWTGSTPAVASAVITYLLTLPEIDGNAAEIALAEQDALDAAEAGPVGCEHTDGEPVECPEGRCPARYLDRASSPAFTETK